MSWGTCYSGSNNISFSSPPLMSDSRIYTNWELTSKVDKSLQLHNNIKTNGQYRQYLTANADKIIKYNQLQSCNNCGNCPAKYNVNGKHSGPPQLFDCGENVGYGSSDLKNMYLSRTNLQERLHVPHLTQEQYIKLGYQNYN